MNKAATVCSGKTCDVFLCHNSQDKAEVRQIHEALKTRGLTWRTCGQVIAGRRRSKRRSGDPRQRPCLSERRLAPCRSLRST